MDGCNVLPETQFVGTRLRMDTSLVFLWGFPSSLGSCRRERSDFNFKPPLGAPLLIFSSRLSPEVFSTSGYFRKTAGVEIRFFPLLGELPKAIEPHLPVCQLYRWQLGPNMWSAPTTKSLDPIVVAALRVGFQGESHGPATCGFACNCPEPEAWTMEASGHDITITVCTLLVLQYQYAHQCSIKVVVCILVQCDSNSLYISAVLQ